MADFDPDAYLSAKPAGASFDPDAYLGAQPKPAALPDVGEPLIGNGGQFSSGIGALNNAADATSNTLKRAAQNVPHSASEFIQNTVQPIIHPIDTATGIKNLGQGILEKTGLMSGEEHKKYADAVGQFFADRYGSLENAKKTFEQDPVGLAGDLSMVLTGGGSAAARLPGALGKIGEATSALGRTVDPLTPALAAGAKATNLAGRGAAQIAGVTTGAGHQPFEAAARAGLEGGPAAEAFRDSLTGRTPMTDVVGDARGAIAQMRRERGAAYVRDMAATGADKTILSWNDVDTAINDMNKVATYKGQSLSPSTEAMRDKLTDAVNNWKNLKASEFWTPEGFDALKKQVGDLRDASQPHTKERLVADQIYNAVKKSIVDQVPQYAKTMKGYEEASGLIRQIETELSQKPNANIGTSLRKLQSVLRDNVNTSYGHRAELANYLVNAGAPHLLQKLAGQALHSWAPRGLSRMLAAGTMEGLVGLGAGAGFVGAPAVATAAATLPTMSPRLMGNTAYALGTAGRLAQPVASPLVRPARQVGEISRVANAPYGRPLGSPYAP